MEGKMTWVIPTTEVQKFAANENVAACTMTFACDVNVSRGDVYSLKDGLLSPGVNVYYHPCKKVLEIPTDAEVEGGYVVANEGNDREKRYGTPYPTVPCIIYKAADGDVHATANTDVSSWERNHS